MDKDTMQLKIAFSNIDNNHIIIEHLCDEFDIYYDTYYEDDFSNRTSITPTRVDKVFWSKVYDLEIPKNKQGLFVSYLINKYIDKIKELDLLYKNKEYKDE